MKKCDICNIESSKVKAGRWIFYCPDHKDNEQNRSGLASSDSEIGQNLFFILGDDLSSKWVVEYGTDLLGGAMS